MSERCESYFEKAAKLIENIGNKELQNTTEWRALKISIYRNFAQYYSKIGNHEIALNSLKYILPQQKELEEMNIILPGVEFLYINMADLAFKLKNHKESFEFAEMASKLLMRQLNISDEDIFAMKAASLHQKARSNEDSRTQMVRSRKFIALSYCLYLAGKSLMKGKSLLSIQQAAPLLEKAYLISSRYMGPDDKITKSYQKKYENILGVLNQNQSKAMVSAEIFQRQNEVAPPFKGHMKTKSLFLSPRMNFSELPTRNPSHENKKLGLAEEKFATLSTDRSTQNMEIPKGIMKHAKQRSVQWSTNSSQNRNPSPMIIIPFTGKRIERKASQGTITSLFRNRKKSDFTMEKNDLMIFDVGQAPIRKRGSQASTHMGDLHSRNTQTQTSLLHTEDGQYFPRFPDNFSKMMTTETATPREQLTASTSIQTQSNRQYNSKIPTSGFFTRPTTATMSHQRSSTELLIDPTAHRPPPNLVPKLALNSVALRNALAKEGMNTALVFLTDRPKTGQSAKSRTPSKLSLGTSLFSGKLTRPGTALQKTDRGSSPFNRQGSTERQSNRDGLQIGEIKRRPTSAVVTKSNQKFALTKAHHGQYPPTHLNDVDDDDNPHQLDTLEDPLLDHPSPISHRRRDLSPHEEDYFQVNYGAFTDRPHQRDPIEGNLTTSQTEELEQILELENHLQKDPTNLVMRTEATDERTNTRPLISEDYIKNIKGPRKNLSKELVDYLKVTTKQGPQMQTEGALSRNSMSPGLRISTRSPKENFIQQTGDGSPTPFSPVLGGITQMYSNKKNSSEKPVIQVQARFKVAKDLQDFRKLEEEAARKIQQFYRQRRSKRQKNNDVEESSIEMNRQITGIGAFGNLLKGVTEIAKASNEHMIGQPFPGGRTSVHTMSSVLDRESIVHQETEGKKLAKIPDVKEEHIRQKFSDSFQLQRKNESSVEIEKSQFSTISDKLIKPETPKKSANQPFLLNLFNPNVFSGDNSLQLSKNEIIKKTISNLHKVEMSFAKRIQGFASYWRLKIKDISENEGTLVFNTILQNEKVSFEVKSAIDFKTAERLMFQFSVWPLVAESKGLQIDSEESPKRRRSSKISENELFGNPVVIHGFKSQKEKKKMGAEEEISLRRVLAMLTQLVKSKTARYRKKNGYVLQDSKTDPEVDIVRKNREELESYKRKYAEAIKKLSTFYAFHSILHERKDSIILTSTDTLSQSYQKRKEGRKNRKLIHTQVVNTQVKPSSIEIDDENSNTSLHLAPQSIGSHTLLKEEEEEKEKEHTQDAKTTALERKSYKTAVTQKKVLQRGHHEKKRTMTITDLGSFRSGKSRKLRSVTSSKQALDSSPYNNASPGGRYSTMERSQHSNKVMGSYIGFLTKEIESYKNPFLKK